MAVGEKDVRGLFDGVEARDSRFEISSPWIYAWLVLELFVIWVPEA